MCIFFEKKRRGTKKTTVTFLLLLLVSKRESAPLCLLQGGQFSFPPPLIFASPALLPSSFLFNFFCYKGHSLLSLVATALNKKKRSRDGLL